MDTVPATMIPSPPPNVEFGPKIMEALPYANMAQKIYPPPVELSVNNLASTTAKTLEELKHSPSLTAFIAARQRGALGALLEAVRHSAAPLLWKYVAEGIPVHTGPAWTPQALEREST